MFNKFYVSYKYFDPLAKDPTTILSREGQKQKYAITDTL
jgi:hypothetical protein